MVCKLSRKFKDAGRIRAVLQRPVYQEEKIPNNMIVNYTEWSVWVWWVFFSPFNGSSDIYDI